MPGSTLRTLHCHHRKVWTEPPCNGAITDSKSRMDSAVGWQKLTLTLLTKSRALLQHLHHHISCASALPCGFPKFSTKADPNMPLRGASSQKRQMASHMSTAVYSAARQ